MSDLRTRIRQRLEATNKSALQVSREAGGSPSLVQNILSGRSQSPKGDTIARLAEALGVTTQWLMHGEDSGQPAPTAPMASEVRPATVLPPSAFELPRDLPTLGTVAGSVTGKGAFQISSDVVEYVRRPPGLIGVQGAYSLYVEGDSMAPKFEHGELVFVHPHRKVRAGDYIIIQEPDSNNGEAQAFIKRFLSVSGNTLKVEQFNPAAKLDFVIRPGLVWHKVLLGADLFGF